jgi:TatD DNase family protein
MHAYLDAHNHLQGDWLTPYLHEVLTTVQGLPVRWMVVNGTTEADWPTVRQFAENLSFVLPSYGLHPWYLAQRSESWAETLRDYIVKTPAAVGETGLDRWMRDYDFELQQAVLRRHLELAAELERPLTIHCLRAWPALLDLLRSTPRPSCGFLLHSYGGPLELVDSFVELGAYFSFSGYFLNENKKAKLAPFHEIPMDRLLVETDAPAMPLPPEQNEFPLPRNEDGGSPNHPANIRAIYRGFAQIRQLSEQELLEAVRRNFDRLFQKVICGSAPQDTRGSCRIGRLDPKAPNKSNIGLRIQR